MPTIAQLESLLAQDPRDPFTLYALAQEYAKLRSTDKAVEFYDRCLGSDPAYCYAYYHKAKAQHDAGRAADAAATLRAGLTAARAARDSQAVNEIQAFLDEIS